MSVGFFQILIIVVLVFLLFGAGRVPRMMEDLGKGIRSFRKGLTGEEEAGQKKIGNSSEKDKDEE